MLHGKKATAEKIVYGALDMVGAKTGPPPVEVLEQAIKTVTPVLEVRSRRVGGANYQVPIEVPQRRGRRGAALARDLARERREKHMDDKLAGEIIDALEQQGARSSARTTCTRWPRPTRRSRTTAGKGETLAAQR